MNTPRLLAVSMVCSAALALTIGVGVGSVALGIAAGIAALVLATGVIFGLPPLVLVGAMGAMAAAGAATASGVAIPLLVAMALLLWLSVETAWRALDRSRLARTPGGAAMAAVDWAWATAVAMVLLGTVAVGLIVAVLDARVSERGLGPWMVATAVVVAIAAATGLRVVRDRSSGRGLPARGPGSSGPRPRTSPPRPG